MSGGELVFGLCMLNFRFYYPLQYWDLVMLSRAEPSHNITIGTADRYTPILMFQNRRGHGRYTLCFRWFSLDLSILPDRMIVPINGRLWIPRASAMSVILV